MSFSINNLNNILIDLLFKNNVKNNLLNNNNNKFNEEFEELIIDCNNKLLIETKYKYKEKTFPRRLSLYEKNIMDLFGYGELIKMDKSLIIEKVEEEEKPKTLKKGEEIVIVVTELAYFLAEGECKKAIKNFDKKTNSKEYNETYKKYIKTIL